MPSSSASTNISSVCPQPADDRCPDYGCKCGVRGGLCRVHRRTFQPGVWTSASWQHVQRYNRLMCFLFGTVDSVNHGHTRHATSPISLSLWTSSISDSSEWSEFIIWKSFSWSTYIQNRWICQLFFPTHVTFLVVRVSSLLTERRSWINKILLFGTGNHSFERFLQHPSVKRLYKVTYQENYERKS